tara:strand:+ start:314 stop:565 length:252 start_codon:yes stop_codon:yes gene_type:complete
MSLNDSFQKAEKINREQEEKLKAELHKEQNIINQMIQEIMWGSSKSSIIFDARKDFDISLQDAEIYYKQALKHIEEGTKWYKI